MSLGINSTGQVSVTNAATQIIAGNGNREGVIITNTGSVTVFLGEQAVTASTGHALPAGTAITLTCASPVYGITATGTSTVTFLEEQ
jgi:hypothetical protein